MQGEVIGIVVRSIRVQLGLVGLQIEEILFIVESHLHDLDGTRSGDGLHVGPFVEITVDDEFDGCIDLYLDGLLRRLELAFHGGHADGNFGHTELQARNDAIGIYRNYVCILGLISEGAGGIGGGADSHGLAYFHGHVIRVNDSIHGLVSRGKDAVIVRDDAHGEVAVHAEDVAHHDGAVVPLHGDAHEGLLEEKVCLAFPVHREGKRLIGLADEGLGVRGQDVVHGNPLVARLVLRDVHRLRDGRHGELHGHFLGDFSGEEIHLGGSRHLHGRAGEGDAVGDGCIPVSIRGEDIQLGEGALEAHVLGDGRNDLALVLPEEGVPELIVSGGSGGVGHGGSHRKGGIVRIHGVRGLRGMGPEDNLVVLSPHQFHGHLGGEVLESVLLLLGEGGKEDVAVRAGAVHVHVQGGGGGAVTEGLGLETLEVHLESYIHQTALLRGRLGFTLAGHRKEYCGDRQDGINCFFHRY